MSILKFPPVSKDSVLSGEELVGKLKKLVGTEFPLTDKPRTNGATLRKILSDVLDDDSVNVAESSSRT